LTPDEEEALSRLRFNVDFTSEQELRDKIKSISRDIQLLKAVNKERQADTQQKTALLD